MDKPIPQASRDMSVADALAVVNSAANDARHAGDYEKANALVIARVTLYRAALTAAQQPAPPSAPVGVDGGCECDKVCKKGFNHPVDCYLAQQPAQAAPRDADVRELLDAMDNGDDPRPAFIRLRKRYPPKATPPGDDAAGGGQ